VHWCCAAPLRSAAGLLSAAASVLSAALLPIRLRAGVLIPADAATHQRGSTHRGFGLPCHNHVLDAAHQNCGRMNMNLKADLDLRAAVHAAGLPCVPSPMVGADARPDRR